MSDFARVQFSAWLDSDPEKDRVTNTVYFRKNPAVVDWNDFNWSAMTEDIGGAFIAGAGIYLAGCNRAEVRIYDMEQPAPRAPKDNWFGNIPFTAAGVRETALCLSFRGNPTPRQRGRIFLGPFSKNNQEDRPTPAVIAGVLGLATRLSNIGGPDIDWCVFSQTNRALGATLGNSFYPVQLAWVDDAWDTQRSRGLKPTMRSSQPIDDAS